MSVTLYFVAILLTCVLSGLLAWYAWRQRDVPGSRAYARFALGECLLALAEILAMLSATPAQAGFWFQLRFPLLALLPVLWLIFALEYGGWQEWVSPKLFAGLFIIPVVTRILHWTNGLHGLWVKQDVGFRQAGPFWVADLSSRVPGPGFLVHSIYGLLLLLTGIVLLFIIAWRTGRDFRSLPRLRKSQALLLAAAGLVALAFSVISVFSLLPAGALNPFTPGLGLSLALIALAAFRFRFLKVAPAAEANAKLEALAAQTARSLAFVLLLFILMTAGIMGIGYSFYQGYARQFRGQVEDQLAAIGALKVNELTRWRAERLGDAAILYRNPVFTALAQRVLEDPADTSGRAGLQAWLDQYQVYHEYERVFLLDTAGVERIASPATREAVAGHLTQEMAALLNAGRVTLLDFRRDTDDGPVHLALVVPVWTEQGDRPLGLLVLRIDPNAYLYPFIQRWPVPSASGETLLFRREGADVLYLNELRFRSGTALDLRMPLTNTQVPAVRAALGERGIVTGVDYRGVAVIADLRAVPDSPWLLAAKVDAAEVKAPLQARLWQSVLLAIALMVACGAGLGFLWRQQQVRDYRGQVEAGRALRAAEQSYQTLFHEMLDGFAQHEIICDAQGQPVDYRFLAVNPAFERLTGLQAADIIGKTVLQVLPRTEPYWIETYGKVTRTGEPALFEAYAREQGKHFRVTAYRPAANQFACTFADITGRKQAEESLQESEERFRIVAGALPVGFVLHDQDGAIVMCNSVVERILGLTTEQLMGRTPLDPRWRTVHEDGSDFPGETHPAMVSLRQGVEQHGVVMGVHKVSGELTWVSVDSVPIGPAKKPDAVVVMAVDITERRRMEAERQATQAELQRLLAEAEQSYRALLSVSEDQKAAEEEIRQLNAELEQRVRDRTAQLQAVNAELESFAYSVSHDLAAPLRGIDGWSLALLEDYGDRLDATAQRYLGLVRAEAQRMGRLIDDLLQLSRVTRAEMRADAVDLTALAHTVVERLRTLHPERAVEVSIPPDLTARGDARLLDVLLTNLFDNAWKFTGPCAQPRIEFGRMRDEGLGIRDWPNVANPEVTNPQSPIPNSQSPIYYVRDNGVGFDMAHAQKLFAAFQRLHRASEFPGTGIGLATVQRIAQRHGGRAWAEAKPGEGATFFFTLEPDPKGLADL